MRVDNKQENNFVRSFWNVMCAIKNKTCDWNGGDLIQGIREEISDNVVFEQRHNNFLKRKNTVKSIEEWWIFSSFDEIKLWIRLMISNMKFSRCLFT